MMKTGGTDTLLDQVDEVMTSGGFNSLPSPLVVGGLPFEVERAYTAEEGSLDLVVVIDAREGTALQLRQGYLLVERIARALDQARSRRPLTAIVMNRKNAVRVPTEDFLRVGRLLLVTEPDEVERELAPLLPIVLESGDEVASDVMQELAQSNQRGTDAELRQALVAASRLGPGDVQAALVEWVDESFSGEVNPDV